MNAEKITLRSRKVLTLAQQAAQRLQNSNIGTNHLLLGLLEEGEGIAANVLEQLGIDLQKARNDVATTTIHETPANGGGLTEEARQVIALAEEEANSMNHAAIGTEHLLLGMLREEKGAAAHVLHNLGVEFEKTRTLILQTLDRERRKRNP